MKNSLRLRPLATIFTAMTLLVGSFALSGCSDSASNTPSTSNSGSSKDVLYDKPVTIAYLTPSATITRWATQDVPDFKKAITKYVPKAKVISFEAQGDVSTQLQQAKSAIAQGAEVLLVGAVSAAQSGGLVSYAAKNHVPVLAMTLAIDDADIAGMVGDDAVKIGEDLAKWIVANTSDGDTIATIWGDATFTFATDQRKGAMSVLQPLIDSGKRKVVGDQFAQGWLPANAQKLMESALLKAHDKIDAVLSANDDMARGARAALDKAGLTDIPITGIDATLPGVQAILQGKQSMTLYRSFQTEANIAAEATGYLLNGEKLPDSLFPTTVNNGKYDIPFAVVPATVITKDNVQLLIDEGVFTKAEVCKGIESGTGPC